MGKKRLKSVRRVDRTVGELPLNERREIRAHPSLIFDMIYRQAGTLGKAIMEGVMNSVDAGADQCTITLDREKLLISDNGKGFQSYDEITTWFEEFGRPHEDQENKTYGRFHMGRGQLFAFGANVWRTSKYRMVLDSKQDGLAYDLQNNDQGSTKGCDVEVTLYDSLLPSDLEETKRELKIAARWVPIPVALNGETISNDPAECDWYEVTDDAYIELDDQPTLRVYNQGVFVQEFPKHQFNTGGEVVTKVGVELEVNFARNQINYKCPVWQRCREIVNQRVKEEKKRSPTERDRHRDRKALKEGKVHPTELRDCKVFQLVTGRHVALGDVGEHRCAGRWTVAPHKDRVGKKIQTERIATVVTEECLADFGFNSASEFEKWAYEQRFAHPRVGGGVGREVVDTQPVWRAGSRTYVPFEQLIEGMVDEYELLDDSKLRAREVLWLAIIRGLHKNGTADETRYHRWGNADHSANRRIQIGVCEDASIQGWTDATSYIAFNRSFLAEQKFDVCGLTNVACELLFQACHKKSNLEAEDRRTDPKLDALYRESIPQFVGEFVEYAVRRLPQLVESNKGKMTKQQLRLLDEVAKAEKAVAKVTEIEETK